MAEKTIEQYKAIWRNLNDEIKKHLEMQRWWNYLIPPTPFGVWCMMPQNAEAVAKIYKFKTRAETQSVVLMNGEKMMYNVFNLLRLANY
jgi:hypothetical protein